MSLTNLIFLTSALTYIYKGKTTLNEINSIARQANMRGIGEEFMARFWKIAAARCCGRK